MIILQISPENSPGTGVGGVVHALEQEWLRQGHDVRWFGPREAGCAWLASPREGLAGRITHAGRVLWFSTVGTFRARSAVRRLPPGSVSICHNDALAGDVYVNHGLLGAAMMARGNYLWRMVRNPVHLFTAARDGYRFRKGVHKVVVSLSRLDRDRLNSDFGMPHDQLSIIPNGVHLERFVPASPEQRRSARHALALPADAVVVVFVGHEFARKGLAIVLEALESLPRHYLVVVGGSRHEISTLRSRTSAKVGERVRWLGRVPDPREALAASDVLTLPSAYEANPLVVLEALATGLQVVATPVGSVPELLDNDEVARVVARSPADVASALESLSTLNLSRETLARSARQRAAQAGWPAIAQRYVDLFDELLAQRAGQTR